MHTWSERYAVASAIALLFLVLLNNTAVMLGVSLIGLVIGLVIVWRDSLHRAGAVALAGFAAAAAFGAFALLR